MTSCAYWIQCAANGSDRVTTVFPRQGHYAHDSAAIAGFAPADVTIERIGQLLDYDARDLLGA